MRDDALGSCVCAPPPSPVLKIAHSFARYAPTLERELTNGATEKTRKRSRREGGMLGAGGGGEGGKEMSAQLDPAQMGGCRKGMGR